MKLTIFNGSPRGKGSNTRLLLDHFVRGYLTICEANFQMLYLNQQGKTQEYVEKYTDSEYVLLAFPLYTDAMPSIVMNFIEALQPLTSSLVNPCMGFIVQSGFPETIHSRAVEKYLIKLTDRLKCKYLGTVIKGGVEGIQIKPEWMRKNLLKQFYDLGVHFAKTSELHPDIIKSLAGKESMSSSSLFAYKLFQKTGLNNFYWDNQLKKNKVFEKRFDQPF
jgi:multimeric flavodoxin WrbA